MVRTTSAMQPSKPYKQLVRIRSKDGLDRIEVQPTDDAALLMQKVCHTFKDT